MKLTNLLYHITVIALLIAPSFLAEDEPCIEKKTKWCDEHQKQEHLWKVEGHWYLATETPHGQFEIVGLYTRFH